MVKRSRNTLIIIIIIIKREEVEIQPSVRRNDLCSTRVSFILFRGKTFRRLHRKGAEGIWVSPRATMS